MSKPLVVIGSDVTISQSTVGSATSATLGPATPTDSQGGQSISRWEWTLLYKPPGSSAAVRAASQNTNTCIIDGIDTWGNYLVHVWITDSYGKSSESRPEFTPSGAFATVRVTSSGAALEKLATGERDWVERYNKVVNQVERNSASATSFDDLDTTVSRAELEELAGGNETRLHTHPNDSYPLANQLRPGVVYLAEPAADGTHPRVSTQPRAAWEGHWETSSSEDAYDAGANFYRLVFYTPNGCSLSAITCAAESVGQASAHIYEIRKMTPAQFKDKDDSASSDLLATVSVQHSSSSDDGKPWYHCHTFEPLKEIPRNTFVVVIMRQLGGRGSAATAATYDYHPGTHTRARDTETDWTSLDGDTVNLTTNSSAHTESFSYSSYAYAIINVNDYTLAGSETITLTTAGGSATALVEATDWTAATSVYATAQSIRTAINNVAGWEAYIPPTTYAPNSDMVVVRNMGEIGATGNGATLALARNNGGLTFSHFRTPSPVHANPYSFEGGRTGDITQSTDNATTTTAVVNYINANFTHFSAVTDYSSGVPFAKITAVTDVGAVGNNDDTTEIEIATPRTVARNGSATLTPDTGTAVNGETLILEDTDGTSHTITVASLGSGAASTATQINSDDIGNADDFARELNESLVAASAAGSINMDVSVVATRTTTLTQILSGADGNTSITGTLVSGNKVLVNTSGSGHGTQAFTGGVNSLSTGDFSGGVDASAAFGTEHHVTINWRTII